MDKHPVGIAMCIALLLFYYILLFKADVSIKIYWTITAVLHLIYQSRIYINIQNVYYRHKHYRGILRIDIGIWRLSVVFGGYFIPKVIYRPFTNQKSQFHVKVNLKEPFVQLNCYFCNSKMSFRHCCFWQKLNVISLINKTNNFRNYCQLVLQKLCKH